LEKEIY